ncbi:MAG: recombinase XerD [Candidatus Anammoximicrobium sp.]|nr:recombinase XerD [Candidatus Anammoximicrobium sp.]
MPRLISKAPKYRHHKASDQAVVTIQGKDYYLGPWKSRTSRQEYDRLIAEYLANGRIGRDAANHLWVTVAELMASYVRWAKTYYCNSSELPAVAYSFRPLKELYSKTPAAEFGPIKLKAVRQRMIEAGLCRTEINKRIGRVKRLFKWGVENELVPPSVFHGLQAVRGLARGRSEARESKPVKPVPEAFVDAIKPKVAPQIWTMIELQRLTGMRPGEVTVMRTCDIDTSGRVWIYTPASHKTARFGHRRQIYLGPQAQAVLRSWLRTDLQAYLFQPKEAVEWKRQQRGLARKTPLSCGNRPGTNKRSRPRKEPGDRYDVRAYHRAIPHFVRRLTGPEADCPLPAVSGRCARSPSIDSI